MFPARLILLISAAANVVLASAFALKSGVREAPVPSKEQAGRVATPSAAAPSAAPVTWAHLQTLDHVAFVAALRQQGWSRDVLRAIVTARLGQEYGPKFAALNAAHRPPYWRGDRDGDLHPSMSAAARAEARQLSRDYHQALQALLGTDAEDPGLAAHRQRRYGPIAPEKISTLESIESDYRDLIQEARDRAAGRLLDRDREVIRLLEQEREADIAALLTPEEKEAYELRASQTAIGLRFRLQHFNPTEEEYVAIFRLRKAFDDRFGGSNPTPEQRQQRQASESELNQQIAAVLGEERFQEYDLKAHPSWQQAADWVRRQQLPEATAEPLARFGREMQERLQAINRDRSISRADRDAQRAALYHDARLRLGQILPAEHHARYESGPGGWLRSLQPQTR